MSEHPPARTSRPIVAALTIAAAALLGVLVPAPASAVIIPDDALVLSAAPSSVSVGDLVTVTIDATGLDDVYAYELHIDVDPDLLAFVDGSGTTPDGGFGTATEDGGAVAVVVTRLGTSPGLAGDHRLVTLSFTALAAGTTDISLISGFFVDSNNMTTPIDTTPEALSAVVEITPVDDAAADAQATAAGSGTAAAGGAGGSTGSGTGSGSLATTGSDAAPWLLAGLIAVALAGAGSILIMRRRTR